MAQCSRSGRPPRKNTDDSAGKHERKADKPNRNPRCEHSVQAKNVRDERQESTGRETNKRRGRSPNGGSDFFACSRALLILRGENRATDSTNVPGLFTHAPLGLGKLTENLSGMRISVLRILTTRAEKQGQLVRVNVEGGKGTVGLGIGNGSVKKFTLRAHAHPLAGSHRQRACKKARNTGRQDVRGSHTRADNAQNQRKVGNQTVVHAENCRTEGSRQSLARTFSQRAHNFTVNSFIGRHLRGSIIIVIIRGSLFGALGHGQDENRSKHVGEHCRDAGTQRRVRRW